MLTSSAEDSDYTLRKLEAKHLVRRSFSTSFQPHFPHSFQPLQMSTETFTKSLRDCPNESTCVNDGWRFTHLKMVLESDLTRDLLFSVVTLFLVARYQIQLWRH